jgi:uncharacterized protein (TIGR00730 family)
MEAANRGASEAGGISIGLTIRLPHEQFTNPYVNIEVPFYFFFTRKTCLSFSSKVYLAFPGGFGTMDEIFEVLTLMQTGKIPRIPVIFLDKSFWQPILDSIHDKMCIEHGYGTIAHNDTRLYHITDDEDEIIQIIKNAPDHNTSLWAEEAIGLTPFAE